MKKIASFKVDHRFLNPGIYVSLKQELGSSTITTFDIRLTTPYKEPVLTTGVIHAIEHIGATFLRLYSAISDVIIYFGPMGCRTGFYLVVYGDYTSEEILPVIEALFLHIRDFEGKIPGASKRECGNYKDMDLIGAKKAAGTFVDKTLNVIDSNHMYYPK